MTKKLAVILGFTSIIGQIVLLRELIVIFYGNEVAYAVILASWLFWIATGSFVTSKIVHRITHPVNILVFFQWATFFILPVTVFAARLLRHILGIPIGAIIGITPMGISSFILLAPLTFILGSLFTLICRVSTTDTSKESAAPAGLVYFWESIGAVIGGLLFSFVFIHFLSAFEIILIVGCVNLIVGVTLNKISKSKKITAATAIFVVLIAYASGGINKFDLYTRFIQWKGFNVIATSDSIYGNIVVTKMEDEYSLFENGLLSYSTKDMLTSEESVHYALLEHPNPKQVLLLGGGISGGLKEILKHSVNHIDYVELDPALIEISRNYFPKDVIAPLDDPRVNIINSDARFFVKRTQKKYDVIIVNLPDPNTAMINRYYTKEFFSEARKTLNTSGIISLKVSSSENYLSKEAQQFLRSVNTTLKSIFADTISIPGDTNIFIASTKKGVLTYKTGTLIRRLKERRINTHYIREYYMPFSFSDDRIEYIKNVLSKKGSINTDMHPVTYLYNTILFSTHSNTTFKRIMKKITGFNLTHALIIPVAILIIGLFVQKNKTSTSIVMSIAATGVSEIIFQLIVILAFQTLYGFAYYKIGFIISSFMVGLALGSYMATKALECSSLNKMKIYKITQAAICVYPIILPVVFIAFREISTIKTLWFFAGTFALLPIIAGFIGGFQYPVATYLLHESNKESNIVKSAGFLYAVDTFGASLGALFAAAILVPLIGITSLAVLCALINGCVFLLLCRVPYPARLSERV